jgi:hypothetical protein
MSELANVRMRGLLSPVLASAAKQSRHSFSWTASCLAVTVGGRCLFRLSPVSLMSLLSPDAVRRRTWITPSKRSAARGKDRISLLELRSSSTATQLLGWRLCSPRASAAQLGVIHRQGLRPFDDGRLSAHGGWLPVACERPAPVGYRLPVTGRRPIPVRYPLTIKITDKPNK